MAETGTFTLLLQHVENSIHAEQVFCSIVTEMKYMAAFKNQIGLKMVHKENYETSYHRNTAAGNLKRLAAGAGSSEEQLIRMTVECFVEAQEHDQNAEQAMNTISVNTQQEASWIEAARQWHERRKSDLYQAARLLQSSIPAQLWQQGLAMAES